MSKELSLVFRQGTALQTEGGMARLVVPGQEPIDINLNDVGLIAEWAAQAWENLSGEEYKPVVISERGYVAQVPVWLDEEDANFPPPPVTDEKVHIKVGRWNPFKGLRFPSQKGLVR